MRLPDGFYWYLSILCSIIYERWLGLKRIPAATFHGWVRLEILGHILVQFMIISLLSVLLLIFENQIKN
jgi:hypothetical protein